MFEKFIAVQFHIPEEYKELEDEFMAEVLSCLTDSNTNYIYLPKCKSRKFFNVEQLVTGKYEFVDQIKGF